MTGLTEFLLARIAEDEAVARAAIRWSEGADQWADAGEPDWEHIARHDPARVLAECEAKRAIVEEHELVDGKDSWDKPVRGCWNCAGCGTEGEYLRAGPCTTLRLLAMPYRSHPDYDPEWRP